jgi:hypothetical protein
MYPSNSNEHAGLSLPSPVHESAVGDNPHVETQPAAEVFPTNFQNGAPQQQMAQPDPQPPIQQGTSTQSVVNPTTNLVVPAMADDTDLIEKEWVNKAKSIVEKTRYDPYEQSKELTIFKADYMKKRYNKTIKLSE